jgi:hypothetical protein
MSLHFKLIVLFIAFAITGCKGRLEKHGEAFAELIKNDEGIFRGINIGDSQDAVQDIEGIAPIETDENLLSYEGKTGETGNYNIKYGFESGKLYEILVSADFDKLEEGQKMLVGFREYFNEKYGPYEKEGGYLVWNIANGSNNQPVTIEMVDESEYADFKQWSLSIYLHKTVIDNPVSEPTL